MGETPQPAPDAYPHDLAADTRVGRYRIDRVVGRGGMGTVYAAFDEETNREVAIKVLHPDQPRTLRQRFLAECEAEAKIRHPHVMPVYDRGTFEKDRLYFVMELVYEPITLTDVVEAKGQGLLAQKWPRLRHWASNPRLVQDVFVPIAEGVDAANREYGFLHRDLKPDNVLIDVRTRRPYLIDFGICHELGSPLEAGKIFGTPRFLSPEQAVAKVDPRTDVWGLGALLYYLLAGRPPIDPSSPLRQEERQARVADLAKQEEKARAKGDEARAAELAARKQALANPDLRTVEDMLKDARGARYAPLPENAPVAARAIVAKAMARQPAERYENAAALASDLRAWVGGGRVQALAEHDATGAAVAAAGRTVRRHVVTVLWVLLGLAVGIPLGAHFFGPVDESTRVQVAAALEDVEALTAEVNAIAGLPPTSLQAALRWRSVRRELRHLGERALALPPGDERTQAESAVRVLDARTAPPRLVIVDPRERAWEAREAFGVEKAYSLDNEGTDLRPGPYSIRMPVERDGTRPPLRFPVRLPVVIRSRGSTAPDEFRISLARVPSPLPRGMAYVPSPAPGPDGKTRRPFLIGYGEVTCNEYGEWLDELDREERARRLPARGFEADPDTPGRYLAKREFEDLPVTGIRPDDAMAFAAWRSEADGVPLRLASAAEWRRAAGGELSPEEIERFSAPLHFDDRDRLRGDYSPYGAYRMLASPPEIVRVKGGFGVMAETSGIGVRPSPAVFESWRPVEADAVVDAGFRLVQPLRRQ